MRILTIRQVLLLHEYTLKKHGGSSGIRDTNMLESAIHRPFATYAGKDLYESIYQKSAALIHSIAKNHPFLDGNKRTAFTSGYTLLKVNGIRFSAESKEVVGFMSRVANKNLSVDEIADWLRKHCR